jgi:hypothetical protein
VAIGDANEQGGRMAKGFVLEREGLVDSQNAKRKNGKNTIVNIAS